LTALFAAAGSAPTVSGTTMEMPHAPAAQEALDRYNQAMERLKSGDWAGFGAQIEAMRGVLEKLNREPNVTKSPVR
jgi:uncharacterized protein